ncbi:MAG: hypothetical protein IPJ89_01055 [Candidatus Iainarchaeum archaeon]|uniref:Transcription regulator TrmB C-terminal domain-containing protein n=1 Tax=Candidatus Iainarchaeum sp. TaxID=3101447 RepID=A0A7T9DK60_9ARCH|nr:MAG: hypothetical protein IPJ89_01055 [Candidatus Diapherotrites archaeon]
MPLSDSSSAPMRFQMQWLLGPAALIVLAIVLVVAFPSAPAPSAVAPDVASPEPVSEVTTIPPDQARTIALTQCAATYDCTQADCLEKVLTHIDSATQRIQAVLRTPAPKIFRDHLRAAIKRGVKVELILDSSLNPKFFLEGAVVRVKSVNNFVATNFVQVDDTSVLVGTDPAVYAQGADTIRVICRENERDLFQALFSRLWQNESSAFSSQTTEEEVLSDSELSISSGGSGDACVISQCPADSYTCSSTTKIWQNYFCTEDGCAYEILPLYFSADCGYVNPGFDAQGMPLIVITETETDERNVQNEFLEFTALQSLELSGFSLLRNGVPLITFPDPFILDGAARVHTGSGTNTTTAIHLASPTTLWSGETVMATLINPLGNVVAEREFG